MNFVELNNLNPLEELAVGIDFGTTHSLIAISKGKQVKIINDEYARTLIPSFVCITKEGLKVGKKHEKSLVVQSVKRLIGLRKDEIMQANFVQSEIKEAIDQDKISPILVIDHHEYTPVKIASSIFDYLKQQAENHFNQKITKCVVSVPAYFDEFARGQVLAAAKNAGFHVMRLIAEPTAAAYAYGLNKSVRGCYIVYDFGGGTFDVSLLNIDNGIFQVLSTKGDNELGGDDIDLLIAEHFAKLTNLNVSQLLSVAKEAKEYLSNNPEYTNTKYNVVLSRLQFENIIKPLIDRTLNIISEVVSEANDKTIEGIVLVGGSTRIPFISNELKRMFSLPILNDINPDEAVVYGAAQQAENLTSGGANILIDVLPLSIGIELYGGITEHILMRNSPLPISITKEFTTYANNQTAMQFHIVQGEREIASNCRTLGKFELVGIPPMLAGHAKVELTFSIDVDGILSVVAYEKISGAMRQIELRARENIDNETIINMLKDSYDNLEGDYHEKLFRQATFEAENLKCNVQKFLNASKEIPYKLRLKLEEKIVQMESIINAKDLDAINKCLSEFKLIIEENLQPIINEQISKNLKGLKI